jgi:hypothetical protein
MKNPRAHTKRGGGGRESLFSPFCYRCCRYSFPVVVATRPTPTSSHSRRQLGGVVVAVSSSSSPSSLRRRSRRTVGVLRRACLTPSALLSLLRCLVFVPLPVVVAAVVVPISSPHRPWPWSLPLQATARSSRWPSSSRPSLVVSLLSFVAWSLPVVSIPISVPSSTHDLRCEQWLAAVVAGAGFLGHYLFQGSSDVAGIRGWRVLTLWVSGAQASQDLPGVMLDPNKPLTSHLNGEEGL